VSVDGELVTVWRGRDAAAAREHALVLAAVGIDHATGRDEGWHVILVAPQDSRRALEQLARYEAENPPQPPEEEVPRARGAGVGAPILFALVMFVSWIFQGAHAFGLDWAAAGVNDADQLRGGAWWRPITALTLHANGGHLLSNVLFGAAFVWFAAQLAGTGVALAAVLVAGAMGNATRALLSPGSYNALGASTAVFGALGLIAGLNGRRRARLEQARLRRWTPVIAAVLLLAFLGAEGEHTDVPAHLTGFLSGLLLGLLLDRPVSDGPPRLATQWKAGLAAVAALVAAWASAFPASPAAG